MTSSRLRAAACGVKKEGKTSAVHEIIVDTLIIALIIVVAILIALIIVCQSCSRLVSRCGNQSISTRLLSPTNRFARGPCGTIR